MHASDTKIVRHLHASDIKIVMRLIELAKKSDMNNKHACIIIDCKGKIISSGFNRSLNKSKSEYGDYTRKNKVSKHAEENALRNVDLKKLNGAKLYVIRYGIHDTNPLLMNSKPCKNCERLIEKCIRNYGLEKVYYSTNETNINI